MAATSVLSNAISACDCIAIAAVMECHFAASAATTPLETPFTEVTPGILGRSLFMYVCGEFESLKFTGFGPGTVENIVSLALWSAVFDPVGLRCDMSLE